MNVIWYQRSHPEDFRPDGVEAESLKSTVYLPAQRLAGLLVARIYNLGLNFEIAQRGAGQLVRIKISLVANDLRLSQWPGTGLFETDGQTTRGTAG